VPVGIALSRSLVKPWADLPGAEGRRADPANMVANQNASVHSRQLYKPWGESRYTYGTLPDQHGARENHWNAKGAKVSAAWPLRVNALTRNAPTR